MADNLVKVVLIKGALVKATVYDVDRVGGW